MCVAEAATGHQRTFSAFLSARTALTAQSDNARLRQHVLDLRRAAREAGCDLSASEALALAAFPELAAALNWTGPVPLAVPGAALGNRSGSEALDPSRQPLANGTDAGRGSGAMTGSGGGAGSGGVLGAGQGAALPGSGGARDMAASSLPGGASAGGASTAEPDSHAGRTDHRAERRHACAAPGWVPFQGFRALGLLYTCCACQTALGVL